MTTAGWRTTSALFVCMSIACGGADRAVPTSPSSTGLASPPSLPPPPYSPLPPITRPARVYSYAEPVSYPVSDLTQHSRFVLYDDRTFALQYERSRGSFEYLGRYTESAAGEVVFDWDGWSTAGPWGATGTIAGDLLAVRYNLIMQLADFEDAAYRRAVPAAGGAQ